MTYTEFKKKLKKLHNLQMKLMDERSLYKEFKKFLRENKIEISYSIICLNLKKKFDNIKTEIQLYDDNITIKISDENNSENFNLEDLYKNTDKKEELIKSLNDKFKIDDLIEKIDFFLTKTKFEKESLKNKFLKILGI